MTDGSFPDAVAFDCDGTIADTEALSEIAWADALEARGITWTEEDFFALIGRPFDVCWDHFRDRGEMGDVDEFRDEVRDRFRVAVDERFIAHDDAVETIRAVADRGIALAVVSASTIDHIELVLERSGVRDLVPVIVASGDTARQKPAPDPYLAACTRLGVSPGRTVGVEDTTTGARSSRSAGLWTVAVRRAHAVPELVQHADVVVDRLDVEHLRLRTSR